MRILLIHNRYNVFGGEDHVVSQQINDLTNLGHDIILFIKDNSAIEKSSIFGKLKIMFSSFFHNKLNTEILKIIKEKKPDIAHVHNVFPLITSYIYTILNKNKIPIIQTIHNYRLICPNGLMYRDNRTCEICLSKNSFLPAVYFRCYRKSIILSFWYACMINEGYKGGHFKEIDKFIALTNFAKMKMVQKGFEDEKIVIIPNYVKQNPELEKDTSNKYFLYIGRLSSEKGILALIDSFQYIYDKDISLIIAGSGPLEKEIERKILSEGLSDKVKTIGFCEGELKISLIRNAFAMVVPTECYEGAVPITIIEAFSMQVPVVASRIGGIQFAIHNGVNGLLFEAGNSKDIADKLVKINRNNDLRLRIAKQGFDNYLNQYTEKIVMDKIIRLYKDTIKNSREDEGIES